MSDIVLKISKSFWTFNISMGIYGFTRGLRSKYDTSPRKVLLSERLLGSLANSVIYFAPFWNLSYLYRLFNRIEIRLRGLNKEDYKKNYEEPFSGYCFHTL